jgi:threonine dehydrogenase-like Zn-dependent dehydrogenase
VKALTFDRKPVRYAAAMVAGRLSPGAGARVGPLELDDIDEPRLPGDGWVRMRPRLAGICGSDLATIDGHSSRYFEPIVSFPFVPGHEVVGELDDGSRVVLEPVLGCAARGIDPPCDACARTDVGNCERVAFGHVKPGLQTGFCKSTGGGWGTALVAHTSQLHAVPDDVTDDDAVMVEPTACAIHGIYGLTDGTEPPGTVVVLGAGTLGLLTIAALKTFVRPGTIVAVAKHPEQRRWARELGADVLVEPGEIRRGVRRLTGSHEYGDVLSGGADVVVDCVGASSSVADAIAVTKPTGRVHLVGMAGDTNVDLTPLWHKEVALVGAYAYGREHDGRRTFDLAFGLVRERQLGRLVTATYPLDRYADAIAHAANAGARGAVKIAFDLTMEKSR